MYQLWSNKKLKKVFATATLAAFAASGMVTPAFAADSTHISEAQQAAFYDDAWIQAQADKEAAMKAEFAKGNYTAEAPYVEVDPYGNNPLAALVMFKTEAETKVSAKVEIPADKSGAYDAESTFVFDFDEYTTEHYIPVYALFDGENTVTLTVTDKAGNAKEYAVNVTAKVPEAYNIAANVLTFDKGNANIKEGLNFVAYVFASSAKIVAYDFNGNYRAIFTNGGMSKIYDLPNGHIAFEDDNVLHGLYYTTGFQEVDMMGRVYQKYAVTGSHHEFIQLENGNWLVDAELPNGNTTEDYFVELDYETGDAVRDWWLKDSMKMNDYAANPYYSYNVVDWAHVNSFVQVPGEDAIWYSARQNDGVYLLNLATNKIDAIIAEDDADYADEIRGTRLTPVITQADGSVITVDEWWVNNKELNPTGAAIDWHNPQDPYFQIENTPFEYVYGQHAVSLLPNGDLFIFDNGDGRSKDADKMISPADETAARAIMKTADKDSQAYKDALATNYSRAVIWHYDLEAGTVEQLWQYGKERGMELYSNYICDVDYLGENHYLFDFGGATTESMFAGGYARVIEVLNGEVINEMNVGTNCYRAERLSPYYGTTGEYDLNQPAGVQKGDLLMNRAVLPGADTATVTMAVDANEYISYEGGTDMDAAAYLDGDKVMVPVRYVANALGADVTWNAADNAATVYADTAKAVFTAGVNGAVIKDNRLMVPMAAVAEALDVPMTYADGVVTFQK